ncbi:MAG: FG-GAP repeat domain-containing protein [Gammaproteobacteria bacterium]
MNNKILSIISGMLLVTASLCAFPSWAENPSAVRILNVGQVCQEDLGEFGKDIPKTGDNWILLYQNTDRTGQTGVKNVRLIVEAKDFAMCSGDNISYVGAGVKNEKPIAIIKNLEGISPGTITTVAINYQLTPEAVAHTKWKINGNSYQLLGNYEKLNETMIKNGETTGSHYRFELETAGKHWVLCRQWMVSQVPVPIVVWAGDLNGDGKLDLILEEGNEHASWWTLYASNQSSPFPAPISPTPFGW